MRLMPVLTTAALLAAAPGLGGCRVTGDRAGGDLAPAPVDVTVISTRGQEMQPYVDAVNHLSRGHLVLVGAGEKWHVHQLSAETDAIKAIAGGRATLGLIPARAFDGAGVTSFDALDAPLLVDSLAIETKILGSDDLTAPMLAGVQPLGLTGLGILPGPMRKPVGLSHPLVVPGDYHGARIAVAPSVTGAKVLAALGADAVPSAFEGAALTGVDGLEQQTESVAGNQYDAPGSTITANVNLSPRPLVLVANTTAWRRLAPGDRRVLQQAVALALAPTAHANAAAAAAGTAMLCRRGNIRFVMATGPQLAALRAALAPVTADLSHNHTTAEEIDRIRVLRSGFEDAATAEAPVCVTAPSGDGGAGIASALDGQYTVTTGPADGDFVPENWGRWVYLLDRGRLAFTQENATACTWGYGRYTINGQQMVWDISGGGGIAPTGAVNKAGEHFVFTWSLYDGLLTLGPAVPTTPGLAVDDNSPTNFRARPWHRVSATPSSAALSRRCPPPPAAFARPTPLDGTWRTAYTRQALASSPLLLDSDEINDQNWGTLTLTFNGDTFTLDHRNPDAHGQEGGTFTVTGDAVTMRNSNGEVFTMRWNIYRNLLALRRDASLGAGPTPLVLQPFARLATP